MLDVEIHRVVDPDDDDPDVVFWSGEWGLREASWGEGDSYEDPAELIANVLDSARGYARRYPVQIAWTLDGDAPPGQTVAEAIAELGISLPSQP